jgi:hypothetical protein
MWLFDKFFWFNINIIQNGNQFYLLPLSFLVGRFSRFAGAAAAAASAGPPPPQLSILLLRRESSPTLLRLMTGLCDKIAARLVGLRCIQE